MKFKRSYSNARNLRSAYKFAFGGDINRAFVISVIRYINRSIKSSIFIVYKIF